MNKQEILRHLSGFCSDIEVDNERFIYTDNIYVTGMEILDNAIIVFYPHYKKEKCDLYPNIDNYDDIIAVWSEYRSRVDKIRKRLQNDLIKG